MSFELIGTADTPQSIADLINERRIELRLTMNDCDHLTGLAGGYCAKIFARDYSKNLGKMSLPILLKAFGLKLAIIADNAEDALPPITKRIVRERAKMARPVEVILPRGTRVEQAARRLEREQAAV